MGWRLLYRIEKRGRANENYEKEVDEVYELDSADDFNAFLVSFKRKGGTVVERRAGLAFYFAVDSVDVERRPPTANGRVQAVATVRLSLLKESRELIAPWELAPFRFRVTSALFEETSTRFYPGVGDLVYPRGSYAPRPLVNTAGGFLSAKTTYALAKITFSYNVPADAFDPRLVWAPLGKINLNTTVVCGMTFPPRTLRLDALNAEFGSERAETNDENGNPTAVYWKFYRVDVALTANPRSYDQLYANVGAHIGVGGTPCRVWRWTDRTDGTARFGSYREYLASGALDGEQLSANVPLLPDGTGVSPVPTYRVGSPFEPVDFAALALPAEPPSRWNVAD